MQHYDEIYKFVVQKSTTEIQINPQCGESVIGPSLLPCKTSSKTRELFTRWSGALITHRNRYLVVLSLSSNTVPAGDPLN